jgi:NADP-dependent 3-hydroxy acid dehydrogenase YdfG
MKRIVLVTGISSKLGLKIAERFAREGYVVYGTARDPKIINNLKGVIPLKLDITDEVQIKNVITFISKKEKKLDLVINTIGNTIVGPINSLSSDQYMKLFESNVLGAFRLMLASIPLMSKKGGRIINISSLNGLVSFPNFSIYSSTKFALEALMRSAYYELYPKKIFVTTISPGAIYSGTDTNNMPHKTAREKFSILKLLLPLVTVEEISSKIFNIVNTNNLTSNVIIGRDALVVYLLHKYLPTSIWNKLMLYIWQK